MKKKLIVFVQNRPTQFDAPLYFLVKGLSEFKLVVFYTEFAAKSSCAFDRETNILPQWDHLKGLDYDARFERSAYRLWRNILLLQPNHVVICGWYPRSHALLTVLLRISGVSIGVRADNTLEHTKLTGIRGWLKRRVMFFWLSLFACWHPVGTLSRAYLERLSAICRPVFYFPYAIDVDWFRQQSALNRKRRDELRQQLGLAPDDYVVLGVMKWNEREDPLTLLDAILKASLQIPNIKLLLVGDGTLKSEIQRRLVSSPERLVAPGYAKYSDLPKYYALADIFVHPARSEPYGVSVQEAMACGLPVIVSDKVGAAADLLERGVNGDIFSVGDSDHLASLLAIWARLSGDDSVREAAWRKAREWSYSLTITEWQRCLGDK